VVKITDILEELAACSLQMRDTMPYPVVSVVRMDHFKNVKPNVASISNASVLKTA
jgi:hypothetical protein